MDQFYVYLDPSLYGLEVKNDVKVSSLCSFNQLSRPGSFCLCLQLSVLPFLDPLSSEPGGYVITLLEPLDLLASGLRVSYDCSPVSDCLELRRVTGLGRDGS